MQQSSFEWYGVIEAAEALEQGDIIFNVPVLETEMDPFENKEKSDDSSSQGDFEFQTYDLIVMTHSCDFVNFNDESRIILCPFRSYSEFRDTTSGNRKKPDWKALRSGRVVAMHLINKCELPNYTFEYQIIILDHVISLRLGYLKKLVGNAGPRVRLLPPYREQLSQAFAKQFMRVGLPNDLPSDDPYKK